MTKPKALLTLALAVLLGVFGAGPRTQAQTDQQGIPQDKIEQLVAPIALYPDELLAQVLMASTYPLEIVEADRWVKANASLKGKALTDALSKQTWDPSVISLCEMPDVLSRMSQNLDWTQDLGNAFLAQQADVMKAVQKLRQAAQKEGNLKTNEQQKVVVEQETIIIQPSNPQVVYAPTYDPAVMYGSAYAYPAPYYPGMYYPPPGYALARGIMWGAGFAIGSAMFGGCDWHGNSVNINNTVINNNNMYKNTNRNTNVNSGNRGSGNKQNWSHDSSHRGNVGYGNQQLNQKYNQGSRGNMSRDQARGYDRPGQGSGGRGGATADRGSAGSRGGSGQAAGGARASDRATTGQRQSSFGGSGSGRDAQQASNRGAQSRNKPDSGLSRSSGGSSRSSGASGRSSGGRSGGGRRR